MMTDAQVYAPDSAQKFRVLICDDQADVLEALRLLLKGQGWQSVAVDSPQELLRTARSSPFDLILVDLNYTLDYAGQCLAAREVGGDYYDFLEIAGHVVGFVLADVSGKGIPAALLMANLQAAFRNQPPGALLRPADGLKAVNRHFHAATEA